VNFIIIFYQKNLPTHMKLYTKSRGSRLWSASHNEKS